MPRAVLLRPLLGLAALLVPALASAQTTTRYDADPAGVIDTHRREDVLQEGIQQRVAEGSLTPRDARHAYRRLDDIRRLDAAYRIPDGALTPDQRRDLIDRLDALATSLAIDQRVTEARNSR